METTGGDGFLQLNEVLPHAVNPQGVGLWGVEARVEETWLASSAAMYQSSLELNHRGQLCSGTEVGLMRRYT